MIHQLDLYGRDKVDKAIMRLQTYEPPEGYYLCFSGGKDSCVIKALADMAGVKYDAQVRLPKMRSNRADGKRGRVMDRTKTITIGDVCEIICKHCVKAHGRCLHKWDCPLLTEIAKYIDRKTENCSEKPNNCEHITEDGVTCAKYPACDDCLDNPLNKVKGSERLVKGSEQTEPTISKMEQVDEPERNMAEDIVESFGFKAESYRQAKAKDEPQTERKNLCGKQICDHLFDDDCALKTDCAWK